MRLVETRFCVEEGRKLNIIQKWGKAIPDYAILSHTWSSDPDDEVVLTDIQHGTHTSKPACAKLEKAMERARLDGYDWLWIDTCCIDKTSSVELQEAINSMYSYYKKSQKCYAYLSDVESEEVGEEFKNSRWWTRGWTLQELLAPEKLEFFNSEWKRIGCKDSLHESITGITKIEHYYLDGSIGVEHASVANRMSWAASRTTTREEDVAYSLMGIFDVNMPMLYGEGATRAFLRLQEEIMRNNEDQSLFVWVKSSDGNKTSDGHHGLLADSPKDFESTGLARPYTDREDYKPSTMTARGLNMTLPLTSKSDGTVVAALRCPLPGHDSGWLAVYLQKLSIGKDQYARVKCGRLASLPRSASVSETGKPQEVYVRQQPRAEVVYPYHFFQLRSLVCSKAYKELAEYRIIEYRSTGTVGPAKIRPTAQPEPWSLVPLVYQIDKKSGSLTVALLIERLWDQEAFVLMLGAGLDFAIGATVCEADAVGSFARMQDDFVPRRLPQDVTLKYHRVQVNVKEDVRVDQKIYFIDLHIDPLPRPPTGAEMLQGTVDVLAGPDKRAAKAEFRDKLKRFLQK